MRKHSMPEMKEGGVNVTPLIDVVMCLIIFFMLVAKIGVSTGGVKMDLPEAIIGVKLEKLTGSLVLNVVDPNIVVDPVTNKPVRVNAAGQRVDPAAPAAAGPTFAQRGKGRLDPIVTAIVDQKEGKPKEIRIEVRGSDGNIIDEPLKRVLEAALKRNKDFSVSIRAQKEIDYQSMEKVIGAVTKAGVKKINFGTVGKRVTG